MSDEDSSVSSLEIEKEEDPDIFLFGDTPSSPDPRLSGLRVGGHKKLSWTPSSKNLKLRKVVPEGSLLTKPYKRQASNLLHYVKNQHQKQKKGAEKEAKAIRMTLSGGTGSAQDEDGGTDHHGLRLSSVVLLTRKIDLPSRHGFSCSGSLLGDGRSSYLMALGRRRVVLPDVVDRNTRDVVEFGSVEYLVPEGHFVELKVVRRGTGSTRISLNFRNIDINIGDSFLPQSGSVAFEPGQMKAFIKIQVQSSPLWTPEGLMDVELSSPVVSIGGGGAGATKLPVLGDLRSCRVVRLDLNSFPYDVEDLEDSSQVIVGFLVFLWSSFHSEVKWALLFRLVPGCAFMINQSITFRLIDRITESDPSNITRVEQITILSLAAGFFVVYLVEMWADIAFGKLRLKGKARHLLRTGAMDTVSQLTPMYQELYDTGRVMKVVDVQLDGSVTAFLTVFELYGSLVKLLFMFLFTAYLGFEEHQKGSSLMLVASIIGLPFVMLAVDLILLFLTAGLAAKKDYLAMEADDIWTSFVVQASFLRQVVTTYRKGFKVTNTFVKLHQLFNDRVFEADMHNRRARWLATMVPKLCQALVGGFVGIAAAQGYLPVATFVVFLSTITNIAPTLGTLFMNFFNVSKGYASMKKLSEFLNADTRRKQLFRGLQLTNHLIKDYRKSPANRWDPEALILHDVEYAFKLVHYRTLPQISCTIEAGQIVALKGRGSVGKSCFLRILARHFMPSKGFVYYPSNWRVRFVDASPSFFGGGLNEDGLGTLESNLKFGTQHVNPDTEAWDSEIWTLLNALRVSEGVIGQTAAAFSLGDSAMKRRQVGLNGEKLSLTDRVLLSIARALLSSPDLLLFSNVLDVLPLDLAVNVLTLLQELVSNRCLKCLAYENKHVRRALRKKKLVIFSTKVAELQSCADAWMELAKLPEPPEVTTQTQAGRNSGTFALTGPARSFLL